MLGQVGQPPVAPIIEVDPTLVVEDTIVVVLTKDEQHNCEKFRKMDLPQFQDGKTKDAYEFLTI